MQEELIKSIEVTGKPVVVSINAGRPLIFNGTADHVPEILTEKKRYSYTSVVRPVKELKGFKIIFLKGESRVVKFEIKVDMLRFYNNELKYASEPGEFKIMIGGNSAEVKEISFELK